MTPRSYLAPAWSENNIMANSTKYVTLTSNGRAVLSECMIVVVSDVIDNNLAVLKTLKARNMPRRAMLDTGLRQHKRDPKYNYGHGVGARPTMP